MEIPLAKMVKKKIKNKAQEKKPHKFLANQRTSKNIAVKHSR